VPLRLPGLPAQSGELCIQAAAGVLRARQVGRSSAQLGVRLRPAGLQAADARRLLQHQAALLRTGADEGADPALADHRRRPRAARQVGEQRLHVARPHLLPVGAVRAAGAALDAAGDLHLGQPGERRGEVSLKRQRHLGAVVAGAGCGAGEDHVVHLGAAQRPGAALSHRPAQRVGHVALAAAVGSHDAREAGQDGELHGVGKALEAGDAQMGEMRGRASQPRRVDGGFGHVASLGEPGRGGKPVKCITRDNCNAWSRTLYEAPETDKAGSCSGWRPLSVPAFPSVPIAAVQYKRRNT